MSCCLRRRRDSYVQLYIRDDVQQTEGEKKGLLAQRFWQWLSLPAFGHPGLSSEPQILAADMLAVLIFHNHVFIFDDSNKKKDHFNTAQRMKKQFSRYHTNEVTAVSTAFIIGYRSPLKEINGWDVRERLVDEVKRRLEIFEQPNLYFSEDQIPELIEMFDELCVKAIELLMDETDDITMRMMSRKIKNVEISMPVPREEDEEESSAKFLGERSVVQRNLSKRSNLLHPYLCFHEINSCST